MQTIIELHIVVYFFINLFMLLSAKILLKKQTKTIFIVFAAIILCLIKFLMDYFAAIIYAQFAVIIFATMSAMIIVFKIKHISKLAAYVGIFMMFYGIVFSLQFVIVSVLGQQSINYASNYFLLCQFAFCLIAFSLVLLFSNLFASIKEEQLSRDCQILIANTKINLSGFIDTGNKLIDPKSKKSVIIVNGEAIKPYISSKLYADIMLSTNKTGQIEQIHKIKYSTISETNYITVFKPEEFLVSGKKIDCYVGVAIKSIIQNYDALLNSSCL